ncbi:recombinase family protein [Vibrio jasicida]|uniref:recombinase family protein n=1 Tax=Vibrio jasicida TaxID=766224 RepID=UPI00406822D9
MAIAYSYIRFSSKAQAEGDSLRRQLQRTKEWCRNNDVELSDKNFQDLGISAFKEKTRPSLDDLFSAIQTGSIVEGDFIILENLDRLSRQGIDHTQDMLRQILRSGVKVVDLTNGLELDKHSLNDLVSVIRIALAADLAYQESKKKSERVLAAKATQRKLVREGKVINKRLPFWIRKSDSYLLNDKAEIVREIIKQRTTGIGFHKIAMALNEKYEAPKAKHWSDTTIREIVKSRALYGSMVDKDGEVENVFPALISFTEWQAIQAEHVSSAGGYTKHNHLARLVKCSCGAAMSKKIQKSKTKTKTHEYNTWKCVAATSGGCEHTSVIRDLDIDIFKSLNHLKINQSKSDSQLNRINQKLEKKNTKLHELEQALLEDDAPIAALTTAIKKTTKELTELRSERDLLSVRTDSKLLIELQDNAVEFNIELRKLVEKIEIIPVNGNIWRITIHQHNGHIVKCLKSRKSQRNEWTRFFGKTEEIARLLEDEMPTEDSDDLK